MALIFIKHTILHLISHVITYKSLNLHFEKNRGLERGLNLEELQKELIGNNVTIRYPKHWTLLDPNNKIKHLSVLEYNGKEIFNEINAYH